MIKNHKFLTPKRKVELFDAIIEILDKHEPLIQGKPVVSSIEELFRKYHDVVVQRDLLLNDKRTIIDSLKNAMDNWDETKDTGDLFDALDEIICDFDG